MLVYCRSYALRFNGDEVTASWCVVSVLPKLEERLLVRDITDKLSDIAYSSNNLQDNVSQMKTPAEVITEIQEEEEKFEKLIATLDEDQRAEADYYYQQGVKVDGIRALL